MKNTNESLLTNDHKKCSESQNETLIHNELKHIPETMLITLWAKAVEYTHPKPLIVDEIAYNIYKGIDYDFRKFKNAKLSQVGCCVRTKLIDGEVKRFFDKHSDAVAIQLGAGLDARYQRLGKPDITHWYDLDLPESIELRKNFIPESDKNSYLPISLFDYEWIKTVKQHNKPVIVVLEGVLMYFTPEEVKNFFMEVSKQFDEVTVVTDLLAYAALKHARQHDAVKKMDKDVMFLWSEKDAHTIETWSPRIHIEKEFFMSDYDFGRYPWLFRMLYKLPYFYKLFNQRVLTLRIANS